MLRGLTTEEVSSGVSEGDLLFNISINDLEKEMNNEVKEFVDATKFFRFIKKKIIAKGCGKMS